MINLILMFVMLLSISLPAQDIAEVLDTKVNDPTEEWMNRISSSPELRLKMMEMLLNKIDNAAEMRKIANTFMDNSNMQKFMMTSPVMNSGNINNVGENSKTNQETKKE